MNRLTHEIAVGINILRHEIAVGIDILTHEFSDSLTTKWTRLSEMIKPSPFLGSCDLLGGAKSKQFGTKATKLIKIRMLDLFFLLRVEPHCEVKTNIDPTRRDSPGR